MTDEFVAPGKHLLLDMWGTALMEDEAQIEEILRHAAKLCDATVLEVSLHHFGEGSGVTGVALLAESHISIHTWPETGFVAIDLFMCGACDPTKAVSYLREKFAPQKLQVSEHTRGVWQSEI